MKKRGKLALFNADGLSPEISKSLNLVIVAILFGNISMTITGGPAWSGFLYELGVNDLVYSILVAVPFAAASLQLIASMIMERSGQRRFLFLFFGILQRVLWIGIGLLPYFIPLSQPVTRILVLLVLIMIQSASGAFMNTSFFSLVADLVPMRIRGRYFAVRSRLATLMAIIASLSCAVLLDIFKGMTGYTLVLLIAGVMGIADIVCFFWVKFPKQHPIQNPQNIIKTFRQVLANKPFMRFTLSWTLWSFAMNLSAPFFNPYMLKDIHMTFTEISIWVTIMSAAGTMLVVTRWGRLMDDFGNKPVVRFCAVIGSITPFLWSFSGPRNFWIIPILQFVSGMVFCAIDLGAQNLYLGLSPNENRSFYIAVFTVITQLIGVMPANIAGGAIASALRPITDAHPVHVLGFAMTNYNWIFVLSGILRIITVIFLLPHIQEEHATSVRVMIGSVRDMLKTSTKDWVLTIKRLPSYTRQRYYAWRTRRKNDKES